MSITIFHNPRCSKSRAALELVRDKSSETTIVEYLKTPPTAQEIDALITLLGIEPRELMRKSEPIYKELGLADSTLDRAALIAAMAANPVLIERPIVIANGKAIIGRPPERVLDIL